LAEILNISAAAVSQNLNGKSSFEIGHLEINAGLIDESLNTIIKGGERRETEIQNAVMIGLGTVNKLIGANIMIITNSRQLAKTIDMSLLLPTSDLDIAAFICAVAGQLLSCCLAIKRGINPDVSRNIKKVTLTK